MPTAATRAESILAATSFSACAVDRHQSFGSCSKKPGSGFDIAIGARPSATAPPARSQAIALVADVDESMPMTRSVFMVCYSKKRAEAAWATPAPVMAILLEFGLFHLSVDHLRDRVHARLGAAVVGLAGHQLAEFGRDFIGRKAR